ncbi:MAG: aminotransferase class I and II [Gemmatimonadota bacterium]|jgi:hypothetical protein
MLPRLTATEYLQPLREGGSLPAVVDTEDGLFVLKFRGAGQGPRALIAELVVGLLALELGLPVPDLARIEVPEGLAADEGDPEIRELVEGSVGANVGLRYLDGAFNYDPRAAGDFVDPALAAAVVWLDAYTTNPDRTPRNPNLLIHERRPWLIDHGSALYAHHAWDGVDDARTRTPFPLIRDHVLLLRADGIAGADERAASALDAAAIARVTESLPDELLMDPLARGSFASADEARERYARYLLRRVEPPRAFVAEAERARDQKRAEKPRRLDARR